MKIHIEEGDKISLLLHFTPYCRESPPLGTTQSKTILDAIDSANSQLDAIDRAATDAAKQQKIQDILKSLDSLIDKDTINLSSDFSSFDFTKQLKAQISDDLPSVSADVNLSWSFVENKGSASLDKLTLSPLLGANSYLGKILSDVDSALSPVRKVLDGLTQDIPFLTRDIPDGVGLDKSKLDKDNNGTVSVIDLLLYVNEIAPADFKITGLNEVSTFITEAANLLDVTEKVKNTAGNSVLLPGSLKFDVQQKQFLGATNLTASLPTIDFSKLTNFKLPILQTQTAVDLFLGKDSNFDLFQYTLPKFTLVTPPALATAIQVPILIPVLRATFGTTIGGSLEFGFGADTKSFYILEAKDNRPEVSFFGEFRVGLTLGKEGVAEVKGGGNVGLEADFNIKADSEGKARTVSFSPSGSAYAYLDASASISAVGAGLDFLNQQVSLASKASGFIAKITKDAGVLGEAGKFIDKGVKAGEKLVSFVTNKAPKGPDLVLFNVKSPRLTLFDFGSSDTNNGGGIPTEPVLATVSGNAIFLNIGTRATERKVVNTTDGSEIFTVLQNGSNFLVSASVSGTVLPQKTYTTPIASANNGNAPAIIADGGENSDTITINAAISSKLNGGKGDDKLFGSSVNDILIGGDNSDTLEGRDGNDILFGDDGIDNLKGGDGEDTLYGGDGVDTLDGGEKDDRLFGDAGEDILTGGTGSDVLDGGDQKDIMNGNEGEDTLYGGQGNDELNGGDDFDVDFLFGEADQDTLISKNGNDFLVGGESDDIYIVDTTLDTIIEFANEGIDIVKSNVTFSLVEVDNVENLTLTGTSNTNGTGNSLDNVITGNTGKNTLDGKAGKDFIDGGADNDTVHYDDSLSGATVNIDETQNYSNTAYPNDLEPSFVIAAGTAGDGFGDTDTLRNLENITGSAYDDILIGNALKNILNGLNGNDLLIGNGGDDILDGGNGNDTVSYRRSVNSANIGVSVDLSTGVGFDGIDGLDTLINIENIIGSQFADRLIGSSQANTVLGGDGKDIIEGKEGEDRLFGENGQDEIFGDSGNDYLVGGADADAIDGGANIDTVSYDDSPTGTIVNIDETQAYSNTAYPSDIEPTFTIASGTALDGFGSTDTLRNLENIIGSAYDDILIGNALKNTLNGLNGNDLLIGNGGDDILDGGNGTDTVSYRRSVNSSNIGVSVDLSTGVGSDGIDGLDTLISIENLIGSQFADRLIGSNQANTILGGDGNDIIDGKEGNDRLFGENGQDEIFGGSGNDYLVGGTGADLLDGGEGNDTASYITSTAGILASLVTKTGAFADAQGDRFISIENLEGSEYDDFLYGDENDNILSGLGGNDTIRGEAGDDRLDGGTGDNLLNAGEGNDTIVAADGKNTVYAESGNDSVLLGNGNNIVFAGDGNNSVVVGNGDNTVYAESGNDSIVVGNGNNTVFAGDGKNTITAGSGNDTIYGGAGTDVIDAGAGNNTVFAYDGQNIVVTQDGDDIIYAGAGRDFISAGGGNDTIFAGDGDNWIAAGTGNNLIYSGSGKNLFILEAGTGFNTIKNFALDKDKLGLTAGLQPDQLTISQVNSDGFFGTQISIAGSGDVLARLEWTSANQLTASSFMPNLPLANSSLISLFG